jgi:hypothetical protein
VEYDRKEWEGFSSGYVIRSAEGRRFFPEIPWNAETAARGNELFSRLRQMADRAGQVEIPEDMVRQHQ